MGAVSLESLPLGFRFRPTDEELINHYLRLKINGRHSEVQVITEIDVCKWEPWDLPRLSVIKTDDPEWFFFCPRDRKYPNGQRSNRATDAGYWKATGKDRTIRSRSYKSASNTTGLIGMKKTLVFYRGRAPKGERTNWIMHEYRPTLKDLDGTGPGQDAYVLCRLFRKPEEKPDALKYYEVDQTGSSPTVTKSSPDDTTSDLLQETATSDMPVGEEFEVANRWLTDKLDNMTPSAQAPVESGSNSYMTSDVEDHMTEETPLEVHMRIKENSKRCEPSYDQIDFTICSSLQSQIDVEPAPYADSPFACDFGHDISEFLFPDVTGEQDISLTELLDEVLHNHDESSCEESTPQKNSVVGREIHLSAQAQPLQIIPPGSSYNVSYSNTGADMFQHEMNMRDSAWNNEHIGAKDTLPMQALFVSSQAEVTCNDQELRMENLGVPGDNFVGQVSQWNNLEESTSRGQVCGTGIKIRSRQPQRPIYDNYVNQGTASRRIRLLTSTANDNLRDTRRSHEEDEVQSIATGVSEASEQSPKFDGQEKYSMSESKQGSTDGENPVNSSVLGGGTQIKIRTRQPQQRPNSNNFLFQGSAARRIRLQINTTPQSITNDTLKDGNRSKEDEEVQSNITEDTVEDSDSSEEEESNITEDTVEDSDENEEEEGEVRPTSAETAEDATKQSPFPDESADKESCLQKIDTIKEIAEESSLELKDESREIAQESSAELNKEFCEGPSTKLRNRAKRDHTLSERPIEEPSESLESLSLHRGPTSSLVISFGISAVIVLFFVSIGFWRALDLGVA